MPPSDWVVVWLAVGAISLALMALLQLGAVVALLKVAVEAQKALRGVQVQVAPLIDRGQALIANADNMVHQAEGVVSSLAAQVKRLEGAVTVASDGVDTLHQGVRQVTRQATGALSAVRAFWSVVRGSRGQRGQVDDFSEWDNG
jgi:uncharacterized protein YoxC